MYFQPLLGQGWTLSFEMFFYLVFGCAILLKLTSGKLPFLAAAFAVLVLLGRFLAPNSGMRYLLTNPIILEFLFGVFVAEVIMRLPAIRSDRLARRLLWIFYSAQILLFGAEFTPLHQDLPLAG